jgi:hypothetical protein
MIEIETKNKYQYMVQIILRSIYIHLISCYFSFKKNFKYRNGIKFYSNNEYFYREELQLRVGSGF